MEIKLENFNDYLEDNHLYNVENYGRYGEIIDKGYIDIYDTDITRENLDEHFMCVLNIFRDGIETDTVQCMYVNMHFADGEVVKLSMFYYFYNLIFWKLPMECGDPLTSRYLFFPENITQGYIKNYIDGVFVEKHHSDFDIIKLNNIIDDCMYKFKYIDEFHLYFLNTIDNESTLQLMQENEEFAQCMRADMTGVPIEDVKNVGMEIEERAAEIIRNSDHCLRDAFRTGEGINPRQYKEFTVNIGTKPNGNGGIYPYVVNTSFANGGLSSWSDMLVDSGAARTAQILSKENVGDAGHFSRVLGLNNESTKIHDDLTYICGTRNFIPVYIKNKKMLHMFKNRWYRNSETGVEHHISLNPLRDNLDLIGKTLYFRSPMTCASAARGQGICARCYGGLAHVNYSLSAGKIAAEILCAILTQMLLSSKHLLESMVVSLNWSPAFYEVMEAKANIIAIKEDLENLEGYKLEFSNVAVENEYEQFEYNAYITSFDVVYPDGSIKTISTQQNDKIYLSNALLDTLTNIDDNIEDNMYSLRFEDIKDEGIFMVKLVNAEISKTLDRITSMIRTSDGITGKSKEKVLADLIDVIIEGRVNIDAVHLEVLLSNQIRRSTTEILEMPEWEYPNAKYHMISLNKALTDHPSVTISLQFEKQSKALYYPLNYKKTKANAIDMFYMVQPQCLDKIPEINSDKPQRLFSKIEEEEED